MHDFPEQLHYLASQRTLFSDICQSHDWQHKYRVLMLAGKALPPLSDAFKRDELRIHGCESAAWLVHQRINGQHYWGFDSDARIIKGVLTALLTQLNGITTAELANVDLRGLYQQLGLQQGLSTSRSNGVAAVLAQIQTQLR